MLNDFEHDALEVIDFKPADRLKITSGVFMDQEGEMVSQQGKTIVVQLESMGLCISIDSSKTKIEKVGAFGTIIN